MIQENANRSNAYIYDNYTTIYEKLGKVTNLFLRLNSAEGIRRFIYMQTEENEDGLENTLIEIPTDNIKKVIKDTYLKIDYLEGKLGIVDATDQFDGITNMALLMLMSNRMSKHYKKKIENENLPEEKYNAYHKNEVCLLRWKDMAMKDLIASLYILTKTDKEYENLMSYGYRKDNQNRDSFVLDLPFFGQICVHFGNKMKYILMDAEKTAESILEKKLELGQISEEKKEELINGIEQEILPNYTGKLYEYSATMPIEYEGRKNREVKEYLGLKEKLPEEINKRDISNLYSLGLNAREIYYFAIKLGLPKRQLEYIVEIENSILNAKIIGRKSLDSTTAEERKLVSDSEKNILVNLQQEGIDK